MHIAEQTSLSEDHDLTIFIRAVAASILKDEFGYLHYHSLDSVWWFI